MGKICTQKFKQPENKKLKEKIKKEEIKKKAIEYYKKALSLDPNFALGYRELGALYFKENNKQEAKMYLTNYLVLCPECKDKEYIERYIKGCENE